MAEEPIHKEGGEGDEGEGSEGGEEGKELTPEQVLELEDQTRRLVKIASKLGDFTEKPTEDFLWALTEDCEKKRLFVCCDGTWQNASGTEAPLTNVGKLSRAVWRLGTDDLHIPEEAYVPHEEYDMPDMDHMEERRYGFVRQIVYYASGVGSLSSLFVDSLFSGATGSGTVTTSCFICNNFNGRSRLDEIILVGFSRGAFTVRCLAHFINKVGLLRRKGLVFLRSVYLAWKEWAGIDGTPAATRLETALDALDDLRLYPVRVNILAEWDCVSAMKSPRDLWKRGGGLSFVNNKVPGCVDHAFHAVALHEKRRSFKPMLWKTLDNQDRTKVRQCAFAGCHSDIGGGNFDVGLSTASLLWMIAQIRDVSEANFDRSTLLQFVSPLPGSYNLRHLPLKSLWLPRSTRKKMYLYNLVDRIETVGRVHESRLWLVLRFLTLGMLDRERDSLWKKRAEAEYLYRNEQGAQPGGQPEEAQQDGADTDEGEEAQQDGEERERWQRAQDARRAELDRINPVSLRIHFTARLLFENRIRRKLHGLDRRLLPGLFRHFILDPDPGDEGSWKWIVKESPGWFLPEDGVNSHEKKMLDEWIAWARRHTNREADGHDPDMEDDVEWIEVLEKLAELDWENPMKTFPWGRAFIQLVWKEFHSLGLRATGEEATGEGATGKGTT